MMEAMKQYERWCAKSLEDTDLTAELAAIKGDEKEIYERFYTDLEFGTGGLRGVLGAGSNRMNLYTVRRATQGFANYLLSHKKHPSAAISCDSRNKSRLFAEAAACVFAANGIAVRIYKTLAPTPMLSWAVRRYGCDAGVMITASHNPAEYNGYKAYGGDGCQIAGEAADAILASIKETDIFDAVKTVPYDDAVKSGLVKYVEPDAIEEYYQRAMECSCRKDIIEKSGISVAYTPLNGAGSVPVREILGRVGVKKLSLVKEQLEPDGNFPTCSYPNPEIPEAMSLGIKLAESEGCDILIATDPDSDRVGAAVRHNGGYQILSGNELGVLLVDYIACAKKESGEMPKNPVMVKSIVTTELAEKVAAAHGIKMINVLTGFKYIGEEIAKLEAKGEEERYLLGFEESIGFLAKPYVRDKDAVSSAMLMVEMAAYHKMQGKTLVDVLAGIYEKFGCYYNNVVSTAFPGSDGMKKMSDLMDKLFAAPPTELAGIKVVSYCDYRAGFSVVDGKKAATGLPSSPVLGLSLQNAGSVVIRPSGTEPKLKVYYMICAADMQSAKALCEKLKTEMQQLLK